MGASPSRASSEWVDGAALTRRKEPLLPTALPCLHGSFNDIIPVDLL
jgi:hypothetical protein